MSSSVVSAIRDTVPISLFNRGLAGRVFDEVKRTGAKVVMKNNAAECVLLSPEEYTRLVDEAEDARLLSIATERMASFNKDDLVPASEVNRHLGITEEELSAMDEVEFE